MLKSFVLDILSSLVRPRGLLIILVAVVFGATATWLAPRDLQPVVVVSWIGEVAMVFILLGGVHAALRGVLSVTNRPELGARVDAVEAQLRQSDLPTIRSNLAILRDSAIDLNQHLMKAEENSIDASRLEQQLNLLQDMVASLEAAVGIIETSSSGVQERIESQLKLLEDSILAARAGKNIETSDGAVLT